MAESTEIALTLPDPVATERLAAIIGKQARPGDAILLSGDLGAGKTHFARAFINALTALPEEVPSPTFTLVQTYDALTQGIPVKIWHFDLYRLKSPEETLELGIDEVFTEGIALIEWPDRLGPFKPRESLELRLAITGEGARHATLLPTPAWDDRAAAIAESFA
jgi:tRNA threonylcarbamoyladenosine biosynthesis protein TsaE